MLYHPHLGEIRPLMDRLYDKWPQLHSRAVKAEQIILNGHIIWQDEAWGIRSQADDRVLYPQDRYTCPCPDYVRGAPVIAGHQFCKHKIALTIYRLILRQHLNEQPDLNLDGDLRVIDDHGVYVCQARIDDSEHLRFQSDISAYNFSCWLYTRPLLRLDIQTPYFSINSIEYSIVTL